MTDIRVRLGDITKIQDDAIVNATNEWMIPGGGVDGAIHFAAGGGLLEECRTFGGCPTGEARITKGYNLQAKYIIHTTGPIYGEAEGSESELLSNCYINSLKLAISNGIRTIAFPSISTGVFSYPIDEAAEIAISSVKAFIDEHPDSLDIVTFVLFSEHDLNVYEAILGLARTSRLKPLEPIKQVLNDWKEEREFPE